MQVLAAGRGARGQPAGHDQRREILAGEQERLHRITGERDVRRERPDATVLGDARYVGIDTERVLDRRAILGARQAGEAGLQDPGHRDSAGCTRHAAPAAADPRDPGAPDLALTACAWIRALAADVAGA